MVHNSLDELNKTMPHYTYASVTQLTSKGTAVTCNANSGTVVTAADALAAGASIAFTINNSLILASTHAVIVSQIWNAADPSEYSIRHAVGNGAIQIVIKNETAGSISEAIFLNFSLIRMGS